jgi:hypothetical protein
MSTQSARQPSVAFKCRTIQRADVVLPVCLPAVSVKNFSSSMSCITPPKSTLRRQHVVFAGNTRTSSVERGTHAASLLGQTARGEKKRWLRKRRHLTRANPLRKTYHRANRAIISLMRGEANNTDHRGHETPQKHCTRPLDRIRSAPP